MGDSLAEHKPINQTCGFWFCGVYCWVFFPLISFSYQLRIECMLICEETKVLLECLWPKTRAIRTACESKYISVVSMPRLTRRKLLFYLKTISGSICYNLIKINLLINEYVANIKMILQIPASRICSAELQRVLPCSEVELLSPVSGSVEKEISFMSMPDSIWI